MPIKFSPTDIVKPFSNLLDELNQGIDDVRDSFLNKKNSDKPNKPDTFSLSEFTAHLSKDGFRLAKNYYYNTFLYFNDVEGGKLGIPILFNCTETLLPGWRTKTQEGKIYGLKYETAIELEQDPVWLTINIDIMHNIEQYFMMNRKELTFDKNSFSPEYKGNYQFELVIQVLDENFKPVNDYHFHNSFVKTVQNINYGADNTDITKVTLEVVYETVSVEEVTMSGSRVRDYSKNPDVYNKNQLSVGPFTTDISRLNLGLDIISDIPSWFKGKVKI